jgi:hypothetical protein
VAIPGDRGGGIPPSKVTNSSETTKFILKKPYIKLTYKKRTDFSVLAKPLPIRLKEI